MPPTSQIIFFIVIPFHAAPLSAHAISVWMHLLERTFAPPSTADYQVHWTNCQVHWTYYG